MPYRLARTAAGQAEIQARALNLSRPVRNLLLILNASQPAEHWLAQVRGCTPADMDLLLDQGLVAPVDAVAAPASTTGAGADSTEQLYKLVQQRVQAAPYAPLYDALNAFGKELLGLVRGYRFALEVERCSGPDELHALALRFLTQVRQDHGADALKRFAELLPAR